MAGWGGKLAANRLGEDWTKSTRPCGEGRRCNSLESRLFGRHLVEMSKIRSHHTVSSCRLHLLRSRMVAIQCFISGILINTSFDTRVPAK